MNADDRKLLRDMLAERNEAMLTLDEAKIRAFAERYGVPMPFDPVAFWAGVHKARYYWTDCPVDKRAESAKYLVDHGFEGVEP